MAAPPFNKTILKNKERIVQALSGSATITNLFQAGDQDRFYRLKVEWVLRNDADLSMSNSGGRHGTIRGDTTTATIVSSAVLYTAASSGTTGVLSFSVSGNTIRINFSNDGAISGEIEYIVTVYS